MLEINTKFLKYSSNITSSKLPPINKIKAEIIIKIIKQYDSEYMV